MSLYVFWLRKGLLIKYIRNCWGMVGGKGGGGIQNAYSCVQWEGVSRLLCTYAPTLSLSMFLATFLSYSFLFYL